MSLSSPSLPLKQPNQTSGSRKLSQEIWKMIVKRYVTDNFLELLSTTPGYSESPPIIRKTVNEHEPHTLSLASCSKDTLAIALGTVRCLTEISAARLITLLNTFEGALVKVEGPDINAGDINLNKSAVIVDNDGYDLRIMIHRACRVKTAFTPPGLSRHLVLPVGSYIQVFATVAKLHQIDLYCNRGRTTVSQSPRFESNRTGLFQVRSESSNTMSSETSISPSDGSSLALGSPEACERRLADLWEVRIKTFIWSERTLVMTLKLKE